MRVGARFAPFRKRRSPLTENFQSSHADVAKRGAQRCARRSPRRRPRRECSTVHSGCVAERARPPPRRVVDRQRPRLAVLARGERDRPRRRPSSTSPAWSDDFGDAAPRRAVRRRRRASTSQVSRLRSASASVHSTRSAAIRTRPVSTTRIGRHGPPGLHCGSAASQCPKTPVTVRFAVRSRCGGHATSSASTCSVALPQRVGDLERVRHEVALGRAEVVAVEPDVAVVEDAVELEERASVRSRGRSRRTRRRYSTGPSDGRELVDAAPMVRQPNRRPVGGRRTHGRRTACARSPSPRRAVQAPVRSTRQRYGGYVATCLSGGCGERGGCGGGSRHVHSPA